MTAAPLARLTPIPRKGVAPLQPSGYEGSTTREKQFVPFRVNPRFNYQPLDFYLRSGTLVRHFVFGGPKTPDYPYGRPMVEHGVVVHCWDDDVIHGYDCWIAFFGVGEKPPIAKPTIKPYILRYAAMGFAPEPPLGATLLERRRRKLRAGRQPPQQPVWAGTPHGPYLPPGTPVRIDLFNESGPEYGVVIHCWLDHEANAWDCYIASFGDWKPIGKPKSNVVRTKRNSGIYTSETMTQICYVARYYSTLLTILDPDQPG